MFYLFLAIISSSLIAIIFKWSEANNRSRYIITSVNYLTAFSISAIMIASKGLLKDFSFPKDFILQLKSLSGSDVLNSSASIVWAVIVGLVFGSFFFFSFFYYQKSVKENGVGISATILKLGILIPMIFSIIIWREYPSFIQWIGIFLALTSIIIFNLSSKSLESFNLKQALILLFIFGGFAEFSNKIYQKYALSAYKDVFLFTIFLTAFIISAYFVIKKKEKINKEDIITGFMVGIPNLFSSYFLILSLDTIKTSVAFPIYSASSIVLINMAGSLFFKEKINNKNKFAIALTIFSLINS